MLQEPLLAGIYDPRRTLAAQRARELVAGALAFHGRPRIEQWGPLTVGLAPGGESVAAEAPTPARCVVEGDPRLNGAWTTEREIATAWRRDGDGVLSALRGSFLLVLWDAEAERGLLARDQLGQRPLLWHGGGARLSFAGDFRPLLDLVSPRPAPDETAIACWLGSMVPSDRRTMFEGVRRLPGGHVLRFQDVWTPRPYWQPQFREPLQGSREVLLAGMVDRLETATAAVLDGAQKPGVLLSGGIDSTTVAAVAEPLANAAGLSLRTYSATFPDLPLADESELVNELVSALRLQNTSMAVHGGSLLAGLLGYTRAWHMPDISANNFFWVELLRLAGQEGVDVLLDGEGGDELFMVPRYLLADLLGRGRLNAARELMDQWPMIAGNQSRRVRARLAWKYGVSGVLPHRVERLLWLARRHESPLPLSPWAERLTRKAADPSSWKRIEGPRWWRHIAHHMTEGPDSFGAPEHALRIARSAGIQRRRPLLDLELTEYVLQLPPQLAFSPWFTKGHIRMAMLDRVPDSVLLRRQKTLFTDVRVRALEADLPHARRLLAEGAEVRRFVSPQVVDELLAGVPRGDPSQRSTWSFRLQHLASTELWLRIQADPGASQDPMRGADLEAVRYELRVTQPGGA